jgi:hypothetical protein
MTIKPRCTTECAEDFKSIQAEKSSLLMAIARKDDFRWLIEAPGQRYLAVRKLAVHEFHWTQDHNKALYFKSQEQADLTMMALRDLMPSLFGFAVTLGDARAAEHAWERPRATG